MFISIHELELHQIDFAEEFRPQAIDFGPDLHQRTGLTTSGHAVLIEEHRGGKETVKDIRLVGDYRTRVELPCARCLDPVLRDVASSFDLLYRPLGVDATTHERAVHEADTEIGYYVGEGLQLQDVLREQVLLAVPIKAVCREDCKGICPHCGRNLNLESCQCGASQPDPRWNALKDLKDKLPG
ncbi:MAG: DUF177 domain-containing protein [Acidobacteriia bacterium]|nr:DUF177 domain-containing protein [Terriglobia bacterium]